MLVYNGTKLLIIFINLTVLKLSFHKIKLYLKRYKENAAGTKVKEHNRVIQELNMKMIYELDQIGQNLDIDLEKKTQRKD